MSGSPRLTGWGWDAHHRFITGAGAALLVFVLLGSHGLPVRAIAAWNAYCLVTLGMAWMAICFHDPYQVRRSARLQDSSATFLFTLIIGAATASLFAVGYLLHAVKDLSAASLRDHIALALGAVFLSWTLIHTLFALRYAHIYYEDAREVARHEIEGGLLFPRDEKAAEEDQGPPDYLDFAYFSFVVGMTAQVSDVQISSRRLRRIALLHGVLSFVFNTAILAIFVNIVAGLL